MPVGFLFAALPPEVNILRLTTGPGSASLQATSTAYAKLASALGRAAAGTDGSMSNMAESWRGPSSEMSQAAFRKHSGWLRQQAAAAAKASAQTTMAAAAYEVARAEMVGVGAWLAKNRAELLVHTASKNAAGILANQVEYAMIWGAAAGVMAGYAGAAGAALAGLPAPIVPTPITTGGGQPSVPVGDFENFVPEQDSVQVGDHTTTDTITNTHTNNTNTNTNTNNTDTGPGDQPRDPGTDPGKTTPDPADPGPDPTQPAEQLPSQADQPSSHLPESLSDSSLDGTGSLDQQGFLGTSPNSTTLAGLSGGVGSLVVLGMTKGGLGAMPGAATGFRMPSNWQLGRGTAFGATPNSTAAGPASRNTPPRGATAPKAQMRRRRRDEEREKSKVFVPGEPQDVPVLEQPPVIGVIEYADEERPEEIVDGQLVLAGVLQSSDDDQALVAENVPGGAHRGRD
ncbi:PPE domain-containing protein [Nocardia asteroides]